MTRELKNEETRMIAIKGIRRTGKSSLLRVGLRKSGLPYIILDARAFGLFSPDHTYDLVASSLSKLIDEHRSIARLLKKVKGISISGVNVDFSSKDRQLSTY
jgi:AAA+ ATPase superfamily predicted ATPase